MAVAPVVARQHVGNHPVEHHTLEKATSTQHHNVPAETITPFRESQKEGLHESISRDMDTAVAVQKQDIAMSAASKPKSASGPPFDVQAHVDGLVTRAIRALAEFQALDQEQVDRIVAKASVAALNQHGVLAKLAVEETGRGLFEDKAVKNMFACENVTSAMKRMKTVGVIHRDILNGIVEIAEPVGVVAAVTPVTNPTSTAIFKALVCLKTRNPIVFGFHPHAQKCSAEAVRIVRDAAVAAGAPANCAQWIEVPSIKATGALMNHPDISVILATGGDAMVKAAYSCGKPAIGVGPGNVPAFVEKTADVARAAYDLVLSKSFDYGMVCASEQAAIIEAPVYDQAMAEMQRLHAHVATSDEKRKLEELAFGVVANSENCGSAKLNPAIVGKSASWLAKQAGFSVPQDTSILLVEADHVEYDEPLTREKLCPILAVIRARDADDGIRLSEQMVEQDGLGHSACIHSTDEEVIEKFGRRIKAVRIITNSPTSLGGIGDIYNAFVPSLTLGCGTYGKNSVSNNVQAVNLINVKRIGHRNNNIQWFKVPAKIYFEPNAIRYLADMRRVNRVFIVTDATMSKLGVVDRIRDVLNRRLNMVTMQVVDTIDSEPSISMVEVGAEQMRNFQPDTIVALGGGSAMDAAKVMWLLYEHPEVSFSDVREKCFDVRKRAFTFPDLGEKAQLVCISTTSGTGSEVTPFACITDPKTGYKYQLTDYALMPTVAIVDPTLVNAMPSRLAADSGMDALARATEAYVSVYANDFTDGLALQAVKLIFENLPASVLKGDAKAREKMHNAGTIAGMASGSAFLGIVHAITHTIGASYRISQGRSNATLLPLGIRYNGRIPTKLTSWPKYEKYVAPQRYQDIAKMLGLPAATPEEGVESYARAVEDLRATLNMEYSFRAQGIEEHDFVANLDEMAFRASDDQSAPANPRLPMVEDLKIIMEAAYYGISFDDIVARRASAQLAKSEVSKKG